MTTKRCPPTASSPVGHSEVWGVAQGVVGVTMDMCVAQEAQKRTSCLWDGDASVKPHRSSVLTFFWGVRALMRGCMSFLGLP